MMRKEDKIRTNLANNLSLISPDLKLVEEEYHLKNDYGSKGFIDILATNSKDNYVIIEIKRSDQSARQTLNEISKYPGLLKQQLFVKPSEIKIIIISTHWHELLIPYSEYMETTIYDVEAYKIKVNNLFKIKSIEQVQTVEKPLERYISRNQLSLLYFDNDKLSNDINIVKNKLEEFGLKDYVLLEMSSESEEIMYPYSIYISFQRYKEKYLLNILDNVASNVSFANKAEDLLEITYEEAENDEEYLLHLEDKILEYLVQKLPHNTIEIGYPEKLVSTLSNKWKVDRLIKGGIFQEDKRLKNEKILIEDLMGLGSSNLITYIKQANSQSKAQINEIVKKCDDILDNSLIWRRHIKSVLKKAKDARTNSAQINVYIYNPVNILEAIFFTACKNEFCFPHYIIQVDYKNEIKTDIYMGELYWNNTNCSFRKIYKKYFNNDVFTFYLLVNDREISKNILKDLGFEYKTQLITIENNNKSEYLLSFEEDKLCYSQLKLDKTIEDFLTNSKEFVKDLYNFYMSTSVGLERY